MYGLSTLNNLVAPSHVSSGHLSPLRSRQRHASDPFAELARSFFATPTTAKRTQPLPSFDLAETSEGYLLHGDLPGFAQDDLEITLHEGILRIKGERRAQSEDANTNFLVKERRDGSFTRQWRLPKNANPESVEAKLEHGVLTVAVAKQEEAKPQTIVIG